MDQERTEFDRIINEKESNLQSLNQKLANRLHIHPMNSKVTEQQKCQTWKHWKAMIHRQNEHYYLQRALGHCEMDFIVDYQVEKPFSECLYMIYLNT